jgi:hypothetical protein
MSRDTERAVQKQADPAASAGPDFDAEHDAERARSVSNAGLRREVQKKASGGAATEGVHDAAARGVSSATTAMPHAEAIQSSFGPGHDVSGITAHVGGTSAAAMGANAYATGGHVVFDKPPDLHTAAHEAAHVMQQAQGVHLYGGVGDAGDSYEQHADAVADRVVAGQSAADLLGAPTAGHAAAGGAVQRDTKKKETNEDAHDAADQQAYEMLYSAIDLAAKRMHLAAEAIEQTIAAPMDEGGKDKKAAIIQYQHDEVYSELVRLRFTAARTKLKPSRGVVRDLEILAGGFKAFDFTMNRALNYIGRDENTLKYLPQAFTGEIGMLATHFGTDYKDLIPRSKDERIDHDLEDMTKEAVVNAVHAIEACAHAIELGMSSGATDAQIAEDVGKLIASVTDAEGQLKHTSMKLGKTGVLARVLGELDKLTPKLEAKPALASMLANSGFRNSVSYLKQRLKTK